jgi:hypothetical protein
MLTKFAREFISLGEAICAGRTIFGFIDSLENSDPNKGIFERELRELGNTFSNIAFLCSELDLPISKELFTRGKDDLPKSGREYEIYITALESEIKNIVFAFLPEHKRKYIAPVKFIPTSIDAFPNAHNELAEAGKSFAFDRYTAAVFHCMRAVEIGMREMATELEVEFGFPLELADWENVIRNIEAKIKAMIERPKGAEKDKDLHFYSNAAMQFRYFKDGFRVRVAHGRATYDEGQALGVIEHSVTFMQELSARLKEPV